MSDTHYYYVYLAKDGYRWYEMKSSDKVSESGEAYTHRNDAVDQARAHAGDGVEVRVEDPPDVAA